MDRRFITVIGISLLFALVVASVFYQMTNRGPAPAAPEASDQKDVVVATKPLGIGATIKPGDVKTTKVPVDQFPKGGFSKVEEVLDRPIISNILQDEPVIDGRLAARGAGIGIAPKIPDGMRAVAVRVTDVSAVSGFVLPGMKVDVLVTGRPPNGADTITRTVLQNIEVLSVGTAIQADPRGQAIQSATINLLVFPEQAETLTLAGNEGRIQLVLRNGSDKNELKTTGTTINELYKGAGKAPVPVSEAKPRIIYRPAPRPVAPVEVKPVSLPPPPQVPEQIIVIRGDKRSVEVIKPAAPAAGAAPGQSDNN